MQHLNLDDVAGRHSIEGVLGLTSKRKWFICPLPGHAHHNNTPSFSVFWWKGKEHFKCHGNCGAKGDVIDLVGYLKIPGYDRSIQHRFKAADILEDRYVKYDIPMPEKDKPLISPWAWQDYLPIGREGLKYLRERGLEYPTIDHFKLGQFKEQAITIPTFHGKRLRGIKCRNFEAHPIRYWAIEGSQKGMFNYDDVATTTGPVFIVKGEIAAMYLWQLGFKACAPTGGEGSYVQEFLQALAFSKNIIIGDNDRDPKVREKMVNYARQRAVLFTAELKFPPEKYKDIDEFLLAEPEKGLETLKSWIDETK
jgi:DNA primase